MDHLSITKNQEIYPGNLKKELESSYAFMDEKEVVKRLFSKDPSLWKTEPEQVKSISNRLGWLILPGNAGELMEFANQVKGEGYKYAVLLGMGGSSLCSEVARQTFEISKGYLELLVLDNTAPDAIEDIEEQVDIKKTLFIVASKSGTTTESLSFFKYFYKKLQDKGIKNAGKNFVAITDDGTPLVKTAEEYKFRKVFVNPLDIGGRYSVLSNFGLLPMALMGIDIKAMLASAQRMKDSCGADKSAANNPGISLGAALGVAQKQGRDKVTFVMSSSIRAFGYWVEQLIAESTGKEGKGLIPVTGEDLGAPEVYGSDRVFVHMYVPSDKNKKTEKKLSALQKAGHPVVNIQVPDIIDLGGEYFRWEVATAIAGIVIGINPFDEPNVAEGKKNTNDLLKEWGEKGSFKKLPVLLNEKDINIFGSKNVHHVSGKSKAAIKNFIHEFMELSKPGDYIALLGYFKETGKRTGILQSWRMQFRDKAKVATTFAYGPRYLHSTGQLHKGGPGTGLYIILTGVSKEKLPIPGEKYSFGILNEAQSLGDFRSLNDKGRRVIYIELGKKIDKGLKQLLESMDKKKSAKHNLESA